MVDFELYLTFLVAVAILILTPGPSVALIVGTSLAHGARGGLTTMAGVSSAIAAQLVVFALGLTSILLLLSDWFEVLRWIGVAYLIYLGIKTWRSAGKTNDSTETRARGHALYWRGVLVAGTNPKVLFFYGAFFPQFLDPGLPLAPQLIILCASFWSIAAMIDGGYAVLAARLADRFRRGARSPWLQRVTGGLFIGVGVGLALARSEPPEVALGRSG